jgi:hypothetical protein
VTHITIWSDVNFLRLDADETWNPGYAAALPPVQPSASGASIRRIGSIAAARRSGGRIGRHGTPKKLNLGADGEQAQSCAGADLVVIDFNLVWNKTVAPCGRVAKLGTSCGLAHDEFRNQQNRSRPNWFFRGNRPHHQPRGTVANRMVLLIDGAQRYTKFAGVTVVTCPDHSDVPEIGRAHV